jgi:hypothetical protein
MAQPRPRRRRRCPKNPSGRRPAYINEAWIRKGKIQRCDIDMCNHWASNKSPLCWCHHWEGVDGIREPWSPYRLYRI